MDPEKVLFPCNGIILEGVLAFPQGEDFFAMVIVCHPHPLYGGDMNNNVVNAVCQKVGEEGLAWLKFNFRGVGRSGGHFGGGIDEREDAKAALAFAQAQGKIDPERIGICGYSFGSLVAFAVAVEDQRIKAVAGISPFIQPGDLLHHYARPKLFICGTHDEYINAKSLEQLVLTLPEPKELTIYPGVDHFWWGDEEKVAERVGQFFAKYFL